MERSKSLSLKADLLRPPINSHVISGVDPSEALSSEADASKPALEKTAAPANTLSAAL